MFRMTQDGCDFSRIHRVRMTRVGTLITSAAFAGMLLAGPQAAFADEAGEAQESLTSTPITQPAAAADTPVDEAAAGSVPGKGTPAASKVQASAAKQAPAAKTKGASTPQQKTGEAKGAASQASGQSESQAVSSSVKAPSGYQEVGASHAGDKGVLEKHYKTDVDGTDAKHEISQGEYDRLSKQADAQGKVKTGTDYYYRDSDEAGNETEHPVTKDDYDQPDHRIVKGYTYYKSSASGTRTQITKEQYDQAMENGGKIADGTEYYYLDQDGIEHSATEQQYANGTGTVVIGHTYDQENEDGSHTPISKEEYDEAVASGKGKYIRTDYTYTDAKGKTVATDEQTYIARPDHTVLIDEHWYREDGTEITKAQYDAAMADQEHPGQTFVRTDYFYQDKDGKKQPATAEQYANGTGQVVIDWHYFYWNPSTGMVFIDKDTYDKGQQEGGSITTEAYFLFVPLWEYENTDGSWHSRYNEECYTPDANPVQVIHIVEDYNQAILHQRSDYGYFYQNADGDFEDLSAETVKGITPTTRTGYALRGHAFYIPEEISGWHGVPVFFDSADSIKAQGGDGFYYWIPVNDSYHYDPNGTIKVYLDPLDVDANGFVKLSSRTIETYTVTPRTRQYRSPVSAYSDTAPVQKEDVYQTASYRPSYAAVNAHDVYVPVEAHDVTSPVMARTIWSEAQADPQYATVEARDHFISLLTRWFAPVQQAHADTGDPSGTSGASKGAHAGNPGQSVRTAAAQTASAQSGGASQTASAASGQHANSSAQAAVDALATSPETGSGATGPLAALMGSLALAFAAVRRLRRRA